MDLSGVSWRKSSYSGSNGGGCVEIADGLPRSVAVIRDSKDPAGPTLAFGARDWREFTDRVKAGEHDLGC